MEINDFYTRMRAEVTEHARTRSESSAFLFWFLENFFRLDKQEATDCICDQKNDKGIVHLDSLKPESSSIRQAILPKRHNFKR